MTTEELLTTIRSTMTKEPTLYHQIAILGSQVYSLVRRLGLAQTEQVIQEYREYVRNHGFLDVVDHQIGYATRLVQREDGLLYEEVHKLFELCDEIESLRGLGFVTNATQFAHFQSDLRRWFESNSRVARLVAQASFEEWKKGWWWYADNL